MGELRVGHIVWGENCNHLFVYLQTQYRYLEFSPGAKYEVGTYKWDVLEQDPGLDHTVQSELEHKVIENGINNNNREHQQGLRTQS